MELFVVQQGRWRTGAGQAALLATLLLTGCGESLERMYSSRLPFDGPIDWWHGLQGGVIASERPPPPGAGEPFPSLGTVPARPKPTDTATRTAISARLGAERTQMVRDAAQNPLPPFAPPTIPGAPPASPAPGPAGATPPVPALPAAPPPMASIEAASAPPRPPAPAPAPEAPVPPSLRAAAAPVPARPGAAAGGRSATTAPASIEPVPSGPIPALPAAAPPLPSIPGIPALAADPGSVPPPRPTATVAFLPGSAVLRPEGEDALRLLAARRAGGTVAVLGGGDSLSAAPDAQAAALPLAWRRARAMEGVLAAAGVPATAMRIDAAALGRGGVARLVN